MTATEILHAAFERFRTGGRGGAVARVPAYEIGVGLITAARGFEGNPAATQEFIGSTRTGVAAVLVHSRMDGR
jgi:hypothetical protein